MDERIEKISSTELDRRLRDLVPVEPMPGVYQGLVLGFANPNAQERPYETGLGEPDVLYAWLPEDADVVGLVVDTLEKLGLAFLGDLSQLKIAVLDLTTFLFRLRRSRSRIKDPMLVATLIILDRHTDGLSSSELWERFTQLEPQTFEAPTLAKVEDALAALTRALRHRDPKLWFSDTGKLGRANYEGVLCSQLQGRATTLQ